VVVAADSGGKSKTVTQLIALGFFLGPRWSAATAATCFHWDSSHFVDLVEYIGVIVFGAGTALSVWSGYRYFSHNARLVFGEDGVSK